MSAIRRYAGFAAGGGLWATRNLSHAAFRSSCEIFKNAGRSSSDALGIRFPSLQLVAGEGLHPLRYRLKHLLLGQFDPVLFSLELGTARHVAIADREPVHDRREAVRLFRGNYVIIAPRVGVAVF